MNSEKMRIYSEIYFFYHENAGRSFCVRNNESSDWLFWCHDDCDFSHSLWISWLQEESSWEKTSITAEKSVLDWLVDILFFSFLCHFDDTNFYFFRNSAFWFSEVFIFDFSFFRFSQCHADQSSHLSCQSEHVSVL